MADKAPEPVPAGETQEPPKVTITAKVLRGVVTGGAPELTDEDQER